MFSWICLEGISFNIFECSIFDWSKGSEKDLQPEVPKILPQSADNADLMKLMQMYKVLEDALVEVLVASDHRSDLLLGQPLLVEEKVGHWLGGHPDEASLLEQLQAPVCVKVELLDCLKEFSFVSDPPSLWGTLFATIDHRTSVLIRFCGREVVRILAEETVQAAQVNTVGVRGGGVCAAWNVRVDGVSGPEDWPEIKDLFDLRNKILNKNAIWKNAM